MLRLAKTQGTSPKVDKFSKQGTAEPLEWTLKFQHKYGIRKGKDFLYCYMDTHSHTSCSRMEPGSYWQSHPKGKERSVGMPAAIMVNELFQNHAK